jgi:tetraacyldisaccharide 4'-kinase
VISDDGLQHYRLARDLEIVIVDNARQFGNQQSLPAGPLREPISRLKEVNLTIVNGGDAKDQFSFSVVPGSLVSLGSVEVKNISDMQGETVHAVAGIGNPERFFTLLEESGIKVIKHVFPDHYYFQKKDIMFHDEYPVIMTEKDAVKCRQFGLANSWYLQIAIEPNARLQESLLSQIKKVEVGPCKTN